MDQKEFILNNLGIDLEKFGCTNTFVDYGNVDHWYDKDTFPFEGQKIEKGKKIFISIEKLGGFIDLFSKKKFFYYGFDRKKKSSLHIKVLSEKEARFTPVTKPIQKIKHYLVPNDKIDKNHSQVCQDQDGDYIYVYKCNFDVEIAVDALRLLDKYDTFAIFTSDRDFISLIKHLKKCGKKIILFYSGPTAKELKDLADLRINGQQIRELIGEVK